MQCHTDKMIERRRETNLVNSVARAVVSEVKAKLHWTLGCLYGSCVFIPRLLRVSCKGSATHEEAQKDEEKLLWLG